MNITIPVHLQHLMLSLGRPRKSPAHALFHLTLKALLLVMSFGSAFSDGWACLYQVLKKATPIGKLPSTTFPASALMSCWMNSRSQPRQTALCLVACRCTFLPTPLPHALPLATCMTHTIIYSQIEKCKQSCAASVLPSPSKGSRDCGLQGSNELCIIFLRTYIYTYIYIYTCMSVYG